MNITRILCAGCVALLGTSVSAETIYRCESERGLVFSDRPCAADAVVHATDSSHVTVYEAPPISSRASGARSSNASRSTHQKANANARQHAKHQAACTKLDQSLRDVRTRLRTGYGVKEGERLKARQRQLAQRRRSEKCR